MTTDDAVTGALKKLTPGHASMLRIPYGQVFYLPSGADTVEVRIAGDTGPRVSLGAVLGNPAVGFGDGAGTNWGLFTVTSGLVTLTSAGMRIVLPSGTDSLDVRVAGDTGSRVSLGTVFGNPSIALSDGAGTSYGFVTGTSGLWTLSSANFRAPALGVTGLTGAVNPARIVGATTTGAAPTTGTWLFGDVVLGTFGGLATFWVCVSAGTPGTWVQTSSASGQPLDQDLTDIAALTPSNDDVMQRKAGAWTNRTLAQLRTDLGISADSLTTFSNAAYTGLSTDRNIFQIGTMSASRAVSLPAASSVPAGASILVGDSSGSVTATNSIVVTRVGSDTIDGSTIATLTTAYSSLRFTSDGTSKWTFSKTHLFPALNLSDLANAATARTNLGLVIGTDVQAHDADLDAIAGLTATTDNIIQSVGSAWASRTPAQVKAALAIAEADVTNLVTDLGNKQPLDADLTTLAGLTATTDNMIQSVGSAWASRTPAQVKTALALTVGTDVQAHDADLDTIAGLTATTDSFMQAKGSAWSARTIAQVKTDLGLPVTTLVTTDTAWAAKGDLIVGTANDTAAVLTAGSNTQVLTADSTQTTGLKWAAPAGGGDMLAANNLSDLANKATARTNLGYETVTPIADTAYTALATDRTVLYTSISAARIVTLPAASAVAAGFTLTVSDASGSCSATNTITLARAGADTVNTTTFAVINTAYGSLQLTSDGTSKWMFASNRLLANANLSELTNAATARTNLGVQPTASPTFTGTLTAATTNLGATTTTTLTATTTTLGTTTFQLGYNPQTSATYTLVLGDANSLVRMGSASASTLTIPANSSVAFPVGTIIYFSCSGAGGLTLAITTDTFAGATTYANGTGGYIIKRTSTTWIAFKTA